MPRSRVCAAMTRMPPNLDAFADVDGHRFKLGANRVREPRVGAPSRRVAVLVPCYNEGLTIGAVVGAFTEALPAAEVYVYDNNSTDETARVARDLGAVVRIERRQGKGHVVRRMFADIDADCYILVDGDDTYDATVAAPARPHGGGTGLRLRQRVPGVVRCRGVSPGPQARQPAADPDRPQHLRPGDDRHAVGLQGPVAPVREIVSGHVGRLRNRDRTDRARARNAHADGRDRGALQGAPARARPASSAPSATACASCC